MLLQLERQTFEYFQYVFPDLQFLFSELRDFRFQVHFFDLHYCISMLLR